MPLLIQLGLVPMAADFGMRNSQDWQVVETCLDGEDDEDAPETLDIASISARAQLDVRACVHIIDVGP